MLDLLSGSVDLNDPSYTSRDHEDHILEYLIEHLDINKTCVEVGASDGIADSNTLRLRQNYGFKALLIEPPGDHYDKLIQLADENHKIECCYISHFGENTLDRLCKKYFDQIGVLSLDIDANELEIFENMTIRPQIIIIEYNNQFPPHIDYQDPANCLFFRHSAKAVSRVAELKNYSTFCITANNVILIDNDLKSHSTDKIFHGSSVEELSPYEKSMTKKYFGLVMTCKQFTIRHIFIRKPNILLRAYALFLELLAFIRAIKKGKFYLSYRLDDRVKIQLDKANLYY